MPEPGQTSRTLGKFTFCTLIDAGKALGSEGKNGPGIKIPEKH